MSIEVTYIFQVISTLLYLLNHKVKSFVPGLSQVTVAKNMVESSDKCSVTGKTALNAKFNKNTYRPTNRQMNDSKKTRPRPKRNPTPSKGIHNEYQTELKGRDHLHHKVSDLCKNSHFCPKDINKKFVFVFIDFSGQ